MDQSILATVNINIGLGKDNPSLIIRKHDNINILIQELIKKYQLPDKVFSIIMDRVSQELQPKVKDRTMHTPTPRQQKKTLSTARSTKNIMMKKNTQNKIHNQQNKENHKYDSNIQKSGKSISKKSLSPLARATKSPNVKKIEIKHSPKPNAKTDSLCYKPSITVANSSTPLNKNSKITTTTSKLQKLFKQLTKSNPTNIKILSPDYINLKGMDRGLLCQLQYFFQQLQQKEFDKMTQHYFQQKVIELGFKDRFSKKQYDYCYLNA